MISDKSVIYQKCPQIFFDPNFGEVEDRVFQINRTHGHISVWQCILLVEVFHVLDGRQLLDLYLVDFGRTFEIPHILVWVTDGSLFPDVVGVSSSQSTLLLRMGNILIGLFRFQRQVESALTLCRGLGV